MEYSAALNFSDGKTFFIDVKNEEFLLDAAVRQGITLPLDCREGVCATCQGRCDSGDYEQEYVDEEALTEEDLSARKILACQTRLKSNATFYFDHSSTFCQTGDTKKIQATVKNIQWVSNETVILTLDLKDHIQPVKFLAGQYARIYIPNTQEYRAYSFAQGITEVHELKFLIRYLADGVMGSFLKNNCHIGQCLDLELPFGSFYLRESKRDNALFFMAGGTGLSSFLAMLDEMPSSNQKIYLYYGVRHEEHLCEQERIFNYKTKFPNFEYIPVISRPTEAWQGLKGYIQDHLTISQLKENAFDMYVCGPPALVESLKLYLNEYQIDNGNFYSEKFLHSSHTLSKESETC